MCVCVYISPLRKVNLFNCFGLSAKTAKKEFLARVRQAIHVNEIEKRFLPKRRRARARSCVKYKIRPQIVLTTKQADIKIEASAQTSLLTFFFLWVWSCDVLQCEPEGT